MICWISILMVVTSRVADSSRVRLILWIVRHPFCTAATSSSSRKITWLVCSIIALQKCPKLYRYCTEILLAWNFLLYSYLYNLYNETEKAEILVSIMLIHLGTILKFPFFPDLIEVCTLSSEILIWFYVITLCKLNLETQCVHLKRILDISTDDLIRFTQMF